MIVDHEMSIKAFHSFTTLLNDAPEALEIEILPTALSPPDGVPFIRDGKHIGVSKKALAAAYRPAVTAIFTTKENTMTAEAVRASAVVLLLSPEHLSAVNLRKRYLISLLEDSKALSQALAFEMRLLDSFFSSPLPRHTKSPTLWSYRCWLMKRFMAQLCSESAQRRHALRALLRSELSVIGRAAAHHPRNYYAFDYMRSLIARIMPRELSSSDNTLVTRDTMRAELALEAIPGIQKFCHAHISDTSAWSVLLFLLRIAGDLHISYETLVATLDMVTRYRWKGEAVWTFLRIAVAGDVQLLEGKRDEIEARLQSFITNLERRAVSSEERYRQVNAEVLLQDRDSRAVLVLAKTAVKYIREHTEDLMR